MKSDGKHDHGVEEKEKRKKIIFIYYEFNIFCEKKHNNQKKKKEIYVSFLTSSTSHSVGEICVIISALLSLLRLS